MVLFVPLELSAIVAMLLQLNGFVVLWEIQQARFNVAILFPLLRKRSYLFQNLKQRNQMCLNWSKPSCCHKPGQADSWWKNMWTGVAPEECWKENFQMSRVCFVNLVTELRPFITFHQT